MAHAFLHTLDDSGVFTFQTFADAADAKNSGLARVFHGTLDQHHAGLTRLQQQGAGVFVMVNRGDGIVRAGSKTCRTVSNVLAVRALFADLDGAPLQPVLDALTPSVVVESSPGRWHTYWITHDCPLGEFRERQQQIARRFRSDPSVCDLPRVMRLPGYWHLKHQPVMAKLTDLGVI